MKHCYATSISLVVSYAQVMLMDLVNKDKNSGMPAPPVWATYQSLLDASEEKKVSYYCRFA